MLDIYLLLPVISGATMEGGCLGVWRPSQTVTMEISSNDQKLGYPHWQTSPLQKILFMTLLVIIVYLTFIFIRENNYNILLIIIFNIT